MLIAVSLFRVARLVVFSIMDRGKCFKPVAVTYSRSELLSLNHVPGRLNAGEWQRLVQLGIIAPRYHPTIRGTRGGTSKQRWIKLVSSYRPPPQSPRLVCQENLIHVVPASEIKQPPDITELPGFCKQIPCMVSLTRVSTPHHGSANLSNLTAIPLNRWELPAVVNTNIHGGLAAKLDEVSVLCEDNHVDIACITETWCSNKVPDAAITLRGYTALRRDRQDGRQCGGILCFIRECIPFHHWETLDSRELESLWFTIRPKRMPREFPCLTFGVVYHPPGAKDKPMVDHIIQCVDHITRKHPNTGIIICGDVNKLKDSYLKSSCQLKQVVSSPTRLQAILDKVYTNMAAFYADITVLPPVGRSDHRVVLCKPAPAETYKGPVISKVMKRNTCPQNKVRFIQALSEVQWECLYRAATCSEQYEILEATIHTLMGEYLPLKSSKRCSTDRLWVTDHFRELVQKRQRAFRSQDSALFRFYRNRVNREAKRLQKAYFEQRLNNLCAHSGQWWSDINVITGRSKSGCSLQGLANQECDGDMQMLADSINSFLQSVTEDFVPITPEDSFTIGQDFQVPDRYIIRVEEVQEKLAHIDTRKATGPDEIPSWILKDCAHLLASPVCAVFNSSLREGFVPTIWKSANICPLPKVNPPTQLEKHIRPISLTPVLAKVMESFTCKWVKDFIANDIDPHQYGSVQNSSTVHALVELVHRWQQALDEPGNALRVLLLDYSKAFDRVDHNILLRKLANMGIPDFLIRWFTSFLCGRRQRTKIGDILSEWTSINAGVPQGTLFGPVGFIVHINDLRSVLDITKYVDDSSLWEVCDNLGISSNLQQGATEAIQWSDNNLMKANCDKTKELLVDFSRKVSDIPCVNIKGTDIERVQCAKLLGVIITSDLTWGEHVDNVHNRAAQRLYFLRLLKRAGMPADSMVKVYTAIVRSLTEYACQVWHTGLTAQQSDKLESIQKRALGIIFPDRSYRAALALSGLQTMGDRRELLCKQFFLAMQEPGHRLHHLLPVRRETGYRLRNNSLPRIRAKHERFRRTLIPYGLSNWQ